MSLTPPDIRELKAILDWANLTEDVRELSIKFGDVELFISRDRQPSIGHPVAAQGSATATAISPPVAPVPLHPPAAAPVALSQLQASDALASDEVLIKAPMVGLFYSSPKPGDPAFVAVGDKVGVETVLCIVEVMKLMSNVEARVEGTVTKILVENEQAVEYGQPLMVIKRDA
ncbi:acetyl-CoA carboxylase biotin carboxyl carrier protein [Arthrobacter sp. D1-29]